MDLEWALQLELVGRMALALVIGFIIGLERKASGHPAGERTHALVSLGSATFTIVSIYAFPVGDPGRVAAQIVTGLGFLGAGIIFRGRESFEVHGLTTAAGIWAVGAIGMTIGAGLYLIGICSATLLLLVLISERFINRWQKKRK